MLKYKPISSALRKNDGKLKAFIRSAFLPHERGPEDPTEETEASAPAEPQWSPDQISFEDEVEDIPAPVEAEHVASVPVDAKSTEDRIKAIFDPALIESGAAAARQLFGKAIASPDDLQKFSEGQAAARALRFGPIGGSESDLHQYENGRMAAKRLLGQFVAPPEETAKFAEGEAAARALLGKKSSVQPIA